MVALYDRIADLYDRLAAPSWERTIGRRAIQCVRGQLRQYTRPGARVLDVGAGTGRSAVLVLEQAEPNQVVLTDLSVKMLTRARRRLVASRVQLVQADATSLPFPDESFDLVLSLWMLETLPDPLLALSECLRVVRTEGRVLTAFSSAPKARLQRLRAWLIGRAMESWFSGRFLVEQERPLHTCTMDCMHRYELGLATVASFGKRCQITALGAAGAFLLGAALSFACWAA